MRVRDNAGWLPLHCACGANPSVGVVEYLAPLGGAISESTDNGYLPLMVACTTGASVDVVNMLLKAYPDALQDMLAFFNP